MRRWSRLNRRHRSTVDGRAAPDAQRRVSALPDAGRRLAAGAGSTARTIDDQFCERIQAYMQKAAPGGQGPHELDQPEQAYDEARAASSSAAPGPTASNRVPRRLRAPSSGRVGRCGLFNSPVADRCSRSPRRACPTSTRAPSSGTSASSTRTTAGRGLARTPPVTCRPQPERDKQRERERDWQPSSCRGSTGQTAASSSSWRFVRWPVAGTQPDLFAEGAYLPLQGVGAHADRPAPSRGATAGVPWSSSFPVSPRR